MAIGCFCCLKPKVAKEKDEEEVVEVMVKVKVKETPNKVVETKTGTNLAKLIHNISFACDSYKHRHAAEEILKIGNGVTNDVSVFTYAELEAATGKFNPDYLLGEGGFGRVYKGRLNESNQDIAVKQLDRDGLQGNREFLIEVLMLSLLNHPNLVNLIGYCADGDQRMLVYDLMPNGSLEDHLLDLSPKQKPLEWNTRMRIAQCTAKGLEYLHDIAKPPVIYRDFKASNILLDKDYNAKLSDFGLAKVGPVGDNSHVSTRVMGTYGYCAPEYALTGRLTTMSDVYSFGVVFLEIITGRRAIDMSKPSSEQHLVQWADPLFKDRKRFVEMADPLLEGNYPTKGLYQALAVAAMCLQEESSSRPLMSDVVTALEYLCNLNPDPKDPIPKSLSFCGTPDMEGASNVKEENPLSSTSKRCKESMGRS